MSELERFVGDRLHTLIGMSDKLIVQYFIGLARKSASVGLFLQKLKETDTVTIDEKMAAFAEEVWKKVQNNAVLCSSCLSVKTISVAYITDHWSSPVERLIVYANEIIC
jgi:hypothetical protein